MYSNYDFVLEWDELPEDFRNEKIDEVIEKKYNNDEYLDLNEDETDQIQKRTLEEIQEDEVIRENIEDWITAHFPMYF